MGKLLLETRVSNLRERIESTPRIGDITLCADMCEVVERMSETEAWELAASKFDYVQTNAEKLIEMISYLNCHNQSVGFDHDYLMTDPRGVYINNIHFHSETFYGALAKCVIYYEFAHEVAVTERMHPPVKWTKHSARTGKLL